MEPILTNEEVDKLLKWIYDMKGVSAEEVNKIAEKFWTKPALRRWTPEPTLTSRIENAIIDEKNAVTEYLKLASDLSNAGFKREGDEVSRSIMVDEVKHEGILRRILESVRGR